MHRPPFRNVRLSCTNNTYGPFYQHLHVCNRDGDELTKLEKGIEKRNHHQELCHCPEPRIWQAMTTLAGTSLSSSDLLVQCYD